MGIADGAGARGVGAVVGLRGAGAPPVDVLGADALGVGLLAKDGDEATGAVGVAGTRGDTWEGLAVG